MLSSLIYGPESLVYKRLDMNTEGMGVKRMNSTRKFMVITHTDDSNGFRIGHVDNQTQTFFPDFVHEFESQINFGDISGFNETLGEMFDIFNVFVLKMIFKYAQYVRFIVPISFNQIKESRGNRARKHIEHIRNMINGNQTELIESIQPIITKAVPGNDEADIDLLR